MIFVILEVKQIKNEPLKLLTGNRSVSFAKGSITKGFRDEQGKIFFGSSVYRNVFKR